MKPYNLSADLEAVIGKGPLPRGQVVKKIWEYIKKNDLQNPKNKRNIIAASTTKNQSRLLSSWERRCTQNYAGLETYILRRI